MERGPAWHAMALTEAKQAAQGDKAPSALHMKAFVVKHSHLLDRVSQLAVLRVVMESVGGGVLMDTTRAEVNINLDRLELAGEEGEGLQALAHIYRIVAARRAALDEPADGAR